MSVRAKFRCNSVEDYGQSKKVNLAPVCADKMGDTPENNSFTKWTPAGALWMTIDNPHASIQFEPGKDYYLDFTECAPKEAA